MCVSKQIKDNILYSKYKTYVIKIGFGNNNALLPLYMRTLHLQFMIFFRLLFLTMSTIWRDKKNLETMLEVNLAVNFFNNLPLGSASIQKCRIRLR